MSSAKTGALTTRPPWVRAASKADWAARLRAGSRSQRATMTLVSMQVIIARGSPGPNGGWRSGRTGFPGSRCRDFCKRAPGLYRPYSYARFVALKHQPVAGLNPQQTTDLVRHRDLSLARDFGFLLHRHLPGFLTLSQLSLPGRIMIRAVPEGTRFHFFAGRSTHTRIEHGFHTDPHVRGYACSDLLHPITRKYGASWRPRLGAGISVIRFCHPGRGVLI